MRIARALAVALALVAPLEFAPPALAQVCAVPGLSGPGNLNNIVNTYYPGSASVSAGSLSIPVGAKDGRGSATDIGAGDLLLVIQVQDASINTSNSSAYGGSGTGQGYTSLNASGLYEYAVATGPVSGGSVPISSGLLNSYTVANANSVSGQKRFQVIRVPQYSTATLTGTVTAPPWNGSTGGVVAFDVAGSLNWNSQAIDVNGRGFRGGGGQCSAAGGIGGGWANTDYVTSTFQRVSPFAALTLGTTGGQGTVPNGAKGEGIAGTPIIVFTPTTPGSNAAGTITNTGGSDGTTGGYPSGSFGRGAPGNAGGGGTDGNPPTNDQNTGGAGGGNFGIGGKGGYGWTPGTPPGFDTGGFGGMSVPSSASRLFFGGGGGAGSTNNCTPPPGNVGTGIASSGAAGGGIVFVRAGSVAGSGTINARGTNADTTILNDASGGGGAGGSALVFVDNSGAPTGTTINVQGGNGGCNTGGGTSTGTCTVPTGGSPHGPGGGGSGGFAITSGSATFNVAGGANGVTAISPTSTSNYGSTASVGGFQITTLAASQIPGAGSTRTCFPQLTVVKTTSTPTASAGATAAYSIVATNAPGRQAATSVTLTDPLPGNPNITYASTSSVLLAGGATRTAVVDPVAGATSPAWGTFSIPGGGSVTINFLANLAAATPLATYQNPANVAYLDPTRTAAQTVTPGGTYTGGGTVGGSNYNAAGSTGEDVTVVTAATVSKSFAPGTVSVGGTTQLSVVIGNPGTVALSGVGLVDNYPAGMVNAATPSAASTCGGTVAAAPSGASFTLGGAAIPAGGSCTITVNVTITSSGPFTNTIPALALTNGQGITNTQPGSATLYSDVTIAKSFSPNAVPANSDSTLTLVLANPNTIPMSLANPGFTDGFPAGLVATGGAVTASGCGAFAPATIASGATSFVATAGTIAAGATCTVSFAVRSATPGIYSNTSSGVTTTQANTTGPPSNSANLGVGLVNIAKAFSPSAILAGGTSTVTLTLTNPSVAQTNASFTDTLAGMSVAATGPAGGTCTGASSNGLTAGQTALAFTGISIPANGSCTVTFTVTSASVGNQVNTTSGVSTALLPAGPASNTATLSVLAQPTIAKAFSPATVTPGASSTLTFTISNSGPQPLSGMSFTDTYPAGLVNATPLAVGGSCTGVTTTAAAGGNTFNVTAGNLPAAASCTITVAVSAAAAGSYPNASLGVATTQTGAAGAGSNTATLFVAAPPSIAKAFGTSPIAQGGTSAITFTLTNANTVGLTNLNFTDALTGMSAAGGAIGGTCAGTTSSPALAPGATNLNLTVPSLAAGATCTVQVTVTSSVSGTHPNTASGVTSTQTPSAGAPSNTASLVVLSPPTLQKNFSPGAIQSGGTASIVFTLANPNAAALSNVTFGDPLANMQLGAAPGVSENCAGSVTPAGVSAGSTSFSLTLNTLNAGETCTITVSPVTSATASPAGGHPNTTSTVTSTQTPSGSPGATGYLNVLLAPTIAKQFSPSSVSGTAVSTITFTLANPNSIALTNVTFTDAFPQSPGSMRTTGAQNFIGAGRGTCTGTIPSAQGAVNQTSLTFSATTLPPNSSCTIMVDVQATADGVYTNTTTGLTSNQTPVAGATATDVLTRGGVSLAKSFAAASVQAGTSTNLVFTLVNNSGANQTGLQFTDTFPAGLVAVGGAVALAGAGCSGLAPNTVSAGAGAYNLTGLTINTGSTCTITLAVQGTTPGVKTNTVNGTGGTPLAGRTDTAALTVYGAPAIAKSFSPATIAAGGASTLTLTLTNPNAFAALTNASFTDTLANMAVSGAQTVGGTCAGTTPNTLSSGATNLSFSGITIPAGGSCTVTLVVTSVTAGVQPNTASGVTTAETPVAGANSGAVNLTVGGINLTKAFADASRPVGLRTTLTITLSSPQAVAWSGLAFTDTLPAGLVVASPANAGTTCGAGTVTASPGTSVVSLSGGTMAAGASPCTVGVDVVSSTAGTYSNATGNFSGLSAGMNAIAASASVQYFPAAVVTKAFSPASIAPGGTTMLTFTLANPAGALGVTGLGFTDTLPAGVTVAAAPGALNNCSATFAPAAGASAVTLTGASLPAGPSSCTAQVNVTASVLGSYTNNSGNFSALAGGLGAATANASFSVVGTALTKSFSPAAVGPNAPSTLTFTIANGAGNPAQSGLAFTDTLPANLVVATPAAAVNNCGGTFTAVAGAGGVSLAGGSLAAAQASCTVSVNVISAQVGTYLNNASNIGGTPASMDKSGVNATLTVLQPPTAAKAFGAASLATGGTTSLSLVFTNANAAAATGLAFTDVFPASPGAMTLANTTTGNTCGGSLTNDAGGALAAGAAGIRLTGGTVPANGTCTVTVNVTAAVAGTYTNTLGAGTITTANAGSVAGATSAAVTFVAPPAISKSFAGPMGVGGTATLTFTLQNPNPAVALSGVAFADTFPVSPGAMVVAATPNATTAGCGTPTFAPAAGAASVAFSGATIAAGATCTVTVDLTAPVAGTYNNASGAVTATGPFALTGGTAVASLSVVQAALAKAFVPAAIDVNGTSTLTFTLANGTGNPAQSAIAFTDTLPASVIVAAVPGIQTNCPAGAGFAAPGFTVTAPAGGGSIAVSGAAMDANVPSCQVRVNVTSATAGTYANTDAGNISAAQRVTTAGVNASLTVSALPGLTKAFSPASVGVGQNAVLTFTITNPPGAPARTGLAFTDTLPAGAVIGTPNGVANGCAGTPAITATPGAGSFTVGGGGVDAAAGPSSCTITVNVTSATPGTYVNGAAQVTAISGMVNGVTDQALAVLARPTLAKAFGAASIASGGTTTLAVTLSNANAVPVTGVAFTDVFPVAPGAMTLANATATNTCGGSLADSGGGVLGAGDAGIQLTGAAIPAGGSCTVTVNVTASVPGTYTNTLAAGALASANASSSTAPASANLAVTAAATIAKAFAPATIAADATSTITFTLGNANPGALTSAAFTDTLANMAIAASGAAGGTCAGAAANSFTAGQTALSFSGLTIPAGGSCTVTVVVASDVPGAHPNQASGVSSAEAVTGAASNTATLTVTAAAPTISKAFAPATINADATSTITFTLANANGVALTSAGFTDNLANMSVAFAGPAGGTCAGAAGNVLAAGQTALAFSNLTIPANGSCTVTAVVTSDTPGTHGNTASGVSSAEAATGAASNTATLTVNAVAPSIAKAFSPGTIAAGATSTITFTLANTLGIALTGGAFGDTLSGMSIASTGPAGGTCAGASGNAFTAGQTALSFTGLTVPANGSCTVTVAVTSIVPGAHNNAATALTSNEAPASAASNTAVLTVTAVAPTITKAYSQASITADATSTITLTIANPLGIALTSAGFTDNLASQWIAAAGAAGGTCAGASGNFLSAGQGNVSITGLTIPAADSCTVTFVVTSDIPGVHPNQASGVTSAEAPGGAPSNTASLTVTAAPPTIVKAFSPAGIVSGGTSSITLTLANTNGIALTSAGFTDALSNMAIAANGPAGGSCAGAPGNAFTAGQTALAFTGLTIPANASCTVTVSVTSVVLGTHPNQASGVSSAQAATGAASNTASLTVQAQPPTIAKQFAPASIVSGGTSTLTVTIGNPNPVPLTVTSVTDTYPAGIVTAGAPATSTTCAGGVVSSNASSVTLTGGTVPASGSCTFQVAVTAATQGLYTNTIPAGALTTSGGSNTSAASATLTVDPVADLVVVKSAPASVGSGQALSYTVSVINNGPDAAGGAQFTDNVPAQVTGVGAVCGAAAGGAACGAVGVAGNAVTSTIATLPAGGSVTFTISGTATGLGTITNTASVAAPGGVLDPAAGNNSASADTTILAPDLTLSKTHAGNFTVGVNGTYTLTVTNGAGSLPTSGVVTVVDTLPAGLGYVAATGSGWACGAAGQVVTCTTSGAIAAGTSGPPISLTVTVASTAVPSVLNTATVSGGGEPAAAANNNSASDNTIVVAAPANAFAPDGARTGVPGSAVFYPHTFNAGLAGSVVFSTSSVATPAVAGWSQTIFRDTNCNGTLDGAEGAAPIAGAIAVNPGDAVCIVVRDSIPASAPYNAQNVITVTSTFNASQAISRTDVTTVGAAGGAGLTLAKAVRNVTQGGVPATTGTALPNDILEYTITYANTSAGPVTAIVVTDATPAFTLHQSAACVPPLPANLTACNVTAQPAVNGTGSVIWTLTGSLASGGSGSVSYQVRVSN